MAKRLSHEEINDLAKQYLDLRQKASKGKPRDVLRFKSFQNLCMQKLQDLVYKKAFRYKRFSNYNDLVQDGFEAMLKSFDSFDHTQGCFSWWAERYIETKLSRSANAHSTIKFPMKVARETKPYKLSTIPVREAPNCDPFEDVQKRQNADNIGAALCELPEMHRRVVSMRYGFGMRELPVNAILEELSISRSQYAKILSEAESQIKRHLLRVA